MDPRDLVESRTTCVYDRSAEVVRVESTDRAASFQYDRASDRRGVLTVGHDWFQWSCDIGGASSGVRPRGNALEGALPFDPCGDRRLANVAGARTTYVYDASDSAYDCHPGTSRTTTVLTPAVDAPIDLLFVRASRHVEEIYVVFRSIVEQHDRGARRPLIGALLELEAVERRLLSAAASFCRAGADPDELAQSIRILVFQELMNGVRFSDCGPTLFAGWLATFIRWLAARAFKASRGDWQAAGSLPEELPGPDPAAKSELEMADELVSRLRPLIPQIADPRDRELVEDFLEGYSIREIALRRYMSKSTVQRRLTAVCASLRALYEASLGARLPAQSKVAESRISRNLSRNSEIRGTPRPLKCM